MDSVEVRFIKDTQNVHTGNEFYTVGMTAHFFVNQTDVLIAQGWAVLASEPPSSASPFPPAPAPNYHKMTWKQLQKLAKERGLSTSRLRKAGLIALLKD